MRSLLICTHHHISAVQGGHSFRAASPHFPGQEPNISFGNYVPSPADLPHLGGCQPRKAMKCVLDCLEYRGLALLLLATLRALNANERKD